MGKNMDKKKQLNVIYLVVALWGIVIIMASGLYVVHRERVTARAITRLPGPV